MHVRTYLCAGRGFEAVQGLLDGGYAGLQRTRRAGRRTHVHHEEVDRRLWRPHHVVARGNELYGAAGQLRPLLLVPPLAVLVQMGEVGGGHVVQHAAYVASADDTDKRMD